MEDIGNLVRRVQQSMAQSVHEGDSLAESARAKGRQAQSLSSRADKEGRKIRGELDRQAAELDELSSRLARQRSDAEAIGELLATLFRQAAELLAAIAQEEAKGREIEQRILKATKESERGKKTLRLELARWSESHDRLQASGFESDRRIDQMTDQLAVLEKGRAQIELVMRELRNEGFKSLEQRLEGTHIEATLVDERERWMRFQLGVQERAKQRAELVLDLELFDWDAEEEARLSERLAELSLPVETVEPVRQPTSEPVRKTRTSKQKTSPSNG